MGQRQELPVGVPGPPLPPGWRWLPSVISAEPFHAVCEYAPLAVKVVKPRGEPWAALRSPRWGAWVRGKRIRQREGVPVLADHPGEKGTKKAADGMLVTYASPMNAANAALAFVTGARVGAPIGEQG